VIAKVVHNIVAVACPANCYACTYDSTLSRTMCVDGRCHANYANAADGSCGGQTQFFMLVETFYLANPLNKCASDTLYILSIDELGVSIAEVCIINCMLV